MDRVLRRRKPVWPNPEDSIGREFLDWRIKGVRCFEATGPVCDIYKDILLPAINKLLAKNKEDLERGETKHLSVGYGMFMVGVKASKATPTVIIASLSKRQRTMIKALIRNERILSKYPAIQVKTLDQKPAILTALIAMDQRRIDLILKGKLNYQLIDEVQFPGDGPLSHGSSIRVGKVNLTLGGVIFINIDGEIGRYGLTAGHGIFDDEDDEEAATSSDSGLLNLAFDSDSDELDLGEINQDCTSKGSS